MRLIIILIFILTHATAQPGPGLTREMIKDRYFPHWQIIATGHAPGEVNWKLKSIYNTNQTIVLFYNYNIGRVTDVIIYSDCVVSGENVKNAIETTLKNAGKNWYIEGPCMVAGCENFTILVSIILNEYGYVLTRRLIRNGQE